MNLEAPTTDALHLTSPAARRCSPCQFACVCSATGLKAKDAGRSASSLGRSLSDHSGSAVLRGGDSNGGTSTGGGSGNDSSSRMQSLATASPSVEDQVLDTDLHSNGRLETSSINTTAR